MLLTNWALGINLGKKILFNPLALLGLALWPCKVAKFICHHPLMRHILNCYWSG